MNKKGSKQNIVNPGVPAGTNKNQVYPSQVLPQQQQQQQPGSNFQNQQQQQMAYSQMQQQQQPMGNMQQQQQPIGNPQQQQQQPITNAQNQQQPINNMQNPQQQQQQQQQNLVNSQIQPQQQQQQQQPINPTQQQQQQQQQNNSIPPETQNRQNTRQNTKDLTQSKVNISEVIDKSKLNTKSPSIRQNQTQENTGKWNPYQEYNRELKYLNYNPLEQVNKNSSMFIDDNNNNQTKNSIVINKNAKNPDTTLLKNSLNLQTLKQKFDVPFEKDNIKVSKELKQLDIYYIDQILQELQSNIKQGPDYQKFRKDFKKFGFKFQRKVESDLMRNLPEEQKNALFREMSRAFKDEEVNQPLVSKIKRIVTYRLEELKRETRDNKWTILVLLYTSLLHWNMCNQDQLERFNFLDIPNDLRQKLWSLILEDKNTTNEYRKQVAENRMLTISQFDVQITRDCEAFVAKHMLIDAFDSKMLYIMKIILSYYERKQDRILSDYHYLICMPLMKVFGNSHYIMNPPSDLVGFYFKLANIVKDIDPLVDLIAKHDHKYDALMTDLFMNSMHKMDDEISKKITKLLNLELVDQRNLLVMLVKRFVHSLGVEFLNLRVVLFIWDQIIMRVYPMHIEIFLVMAITFICLKDKIMKMDTWDQLVEMYYKLAKLIDFRTFVQIYEQKFKDFNFYEPRYNNVDLSDIEYSNILQEEDNAILDKSIINDVTKKAPIKQEPIAKHSTLLQRLQKKKNDESELKERDPELEQALLQNLKMDKLNDHAQMGMFPYVNTDEDDNEDLI